jgi:RNase P subunit RPR2
MNFLERILRRWDRRQALRKLGCACFCPSCNAVVNLRHRVRWTDSDDLMVYRCHCGTVSRWDFHMAPVPLLVKQ